MVPFVAIYILVQNRLGFQARPAYRGREFGFDGRKCEGLVHFLHLLYNLWFCDHVHLLAGKRYGEDGCIGLFTEVDIEVELAPH